MESGNYMDEELMIYILIMGCILILVYDVFKKQLRNIAFNIVVGIIAICIINVLYPEIKVGLNSITVTTVGAMGIPGIVMLYIIRIIL